MDIAKIRIGQLDLRDLSSSELASANSVNEVQGNLTALSANVVADANTWVNANDYSTYSTVTANLYDTYTTVTGLIDTVQDNVSSQTSNTSIVAGGTDLSNTTVFIEGGNGISLSSNTTSKTLTISTSMSNVTSQEFEVDGTANTFTLSKSDSNTHMILVFYNGVAQKPSGYSISGTTLTLSNTRPLVANSDLEVRFFDFFDLPGASEGGGGGGYTFQGSVSGYNSGGDLGPISNVIDKFPFSSDSNATDVGDLNESKYSSAGQSSTTSGYTSGGASPGLPGGIYSNVVDKFPFAADSNATDVGDLTQGRYHTTGQSSSESGYTSGGGASGGVKSNVIDKFPFSTDGNASDVGDLTVSRHKSAGQSSSTSGYTSGGYSSPGPRVNTIDYFSFASDSNAIDWGDLSIANRGSSAGQSSTTHGYTSGGFYELDIIDKFPFASAANASDVGNLTESRYLVAGQSSANNGYTSGGAPGPVNTIDKFPFATDANATDVGDLTQARQSTAGQQV
jgi:hypothetical protein